MKKMKKALSMVLVLMLILTALAGCSSKAAATTDENTPAPTTAAPADNTQAPATNDGTIVKMGIGHLISIAKSTDLGVDKDGKEILPMGEADTIIAAVGFDKDNKVAKITIDYAQTKVNFDKSLKLTSDVKAPQQTKVELGDAYGMIKASTIGKEWYQQIAELEKWMTGKTVDEIKAMKVKAVNEAHPAVPDVPELTSLVTVSVGEYIEAVEEAYANAMPVGAGAVKLGLGHNTSIAKSTSLGKDKDGKEVLPMAEVDTEMAATAFDKDGKVVNTIIDYAQTKINFDNTGKVTSDKTAPGKTKVELGDAYGMIKGSKIGKEWYQQIAELDKWMAGKSIDEIKAMKVKAVDESHNAVPDVPELTSLVTISVGEYIEVVAESYANAR